MAGDFISSIICRLNYYRNDVEAAKKDLVRKEVFFDQCKGELEDEVYRVFGEFVGANIDGPERIDQWNVEYLGGIEPLLRVSVTGKGLSSEETDIFQAFGESYPMPVQVFYDEKK